MNKKGEENYNKYKNQKLLKIGVIGNANKGKTFLLSKISKMNFPSGVSIKTEGLSIKYPDLTQYTERKSVLLDSAGLETPVLISEPNLEKDKKIISISKSNKLSDYTYYFRNIILYRNEDKCEHTEIENNYYLLSKLNIIA